MIKVIIPRMQVTVTDRAMQTFGAMGLSPDTPLADLWIMGRTLRIADGPDEVHLRTIARQEIAKSRETLGAGAAYLHIPEPVSYTHLDVYKRQMPGPIRRC